MYPATDLDAAKEWLAKMSGKRSYFERPFYVGCNVAGYELGLITNTAATEAALEYRVVHQHRLRHQRAPESNKRATDAGLILSAEYHRRIGATAAWLLERSSARTSCGNSFGCPI